MLFFIPYLCIIKPCWFPRGRTWEQIYSNSQNPPHYPQRLLHYPDLRSLLQIYLSFCRKLIESKTRWKHNDEFISGKKKEHFWHMVTKKYHLLEYCGSNIPVNRPEQKRKMDVKWYFRVNKRKLNCFTNLKPPKIVDCNPNFRSLIVARSVAYQQT